MSIDELTREIVGDGRPCMLKELDSDGKTRKLFGWTINESFSLTFKVEKHNEGKVCLKKNFSSMEKALAFYNNL